MRVEDLIAQKDNNSYIYKSVRVSANIQCMIM